MLNVLPDVDKMLKEAGRDPTTLQITVYQVPEDIDLIRRYRDRGIDRVVFELPSAKADEVLPMLDRCAKLMQSAAR